MQDTNVFYEAAKIYRIRGLNAIPCSDEKRPIGSWTQFQNKYLTEEEFKQKLNGHTYGIGILPGKGSGNLEIVDLDNKYDLTGKLVTDYFSLISDTDPDLFKKLLIHRSPSFGFHLYYRCETIEGNQKLARRQATEEELKIKNEKCKVLIETRGHGGFIVAPPTHGYTVWQDNDVPTITIEQRNFLLDAARSFNEYIDEEPKPYKQNEQQFSGESPYEENLTPWEDYNERGDIISLLEKHRWKVAQNFTTSDRLYLIRPGKDGKGYSADYHKGMKRFKCWSTSVGEFEAEHPYRHTKVFAILECGGDMTRACKTLEEMGYGKRNPSIEKKISEGLPNLAKVAEPTTNEPESQRSLSDYDYLLIKKETDIAKEDPVITICGASFAAPNNISMISAAPKGAKTAINNVMVSCSISETGEADGFPDIKARPNTDRYAVLTFDTEQSPADQQYNVNTILKRAGLEETPDLLRCYNIRQLDFHAYTKATNEICHGCFEKFGGIHSIYVDGGADYISSVNDEDQSTEIIQYFIHLSIKYKCPVIIVVHQNPGGDKERGHFGSTGQRKCYGLLSIVKEGDIFTLQPKMMRRAGNSDVPVTQFAYSAAKGYHIQVDQPDKELQRALKAREKLRSIAAEVFPPNNSWKHKDAVSMVMDHTNMRLSTAKTMINDMAGFQYLVKDDHGLYRINMEKVKEVKTGQNGLVNP